jgi:hypothetical protein
MFAVAETKWQVPPNSSFDTAVQALQGHLSAHPEVVAKNGWSLDYGFLSGLVDNYTAAVCQHMKWNEWINEGGAVQQSPFRPISNPPMADPSKILVATASIKKLWAGVKTIDEWVDANAPAVDQSLADSRAATCARCPKNGTGDFSKWFTKPAAAAIKRQVEKFSQRKLVTASDDKLNVCDVCLCPMKLKSWMPIEFIRNHTADDVRLALSKVDGCWITAELGV